MEGPGGTHEGEPRAGEKGRMRMASLPLSANLPLDPLHTILPSFETQALLDGGAIVTAAFYPDERQEGIIKHFNLHEVCHFLLSMR